MMWTLMACVTYRPPPEVRNWQDLQLFPATRWEHDDGRTGWTMQVDRQFVVDVASESAVAACEAEMAKGAPGCTLGYGCSSISYRPPVIWMFVQITDCVLDLRPKLLVVQQYPGVDAHSIPIFGD